ncbi:AAA family ATPase [Roseimarinus sediminis]|uniref:AAA family ATPase n=1 Tax=Roseimarinus sediminis TaxID=1610899 RepID=UPI003D1F1537
MRKIYLKNYKGFKEEVIELKDVNFFVGENSTGKTSILKLINLLCSREFWFNEQFNSEGIELGYFDEILNRNSTEKFFRIGLEITEKKSESATRIVMEFHEHKSIPKIHLIKYQRNNSDILIKITKKQFQYRIKETSKNSFLEWANDFNYSKPFKRVGFPFDNFPMFILFTFIENRINTNKTNKNEQSPFATDPALYRSYKWLAPIRAKAKRIYESYEVKFSPEGEHIPSMIREMFTNTSKNEKGKILRILNQFGKESNLFDEIIVKNFGSKNASPFEIMIRYDETEIKLPNVGYGVSQSLPLVVEILSSKNHAFSIQQPEVHLHPKAQAAFGSFLYNATLKDGNSFLIETHSDFTINRFRYCLSNKKDSKIESQVLFFTREKNMNNVFPINIDSKGSYSNGVPTEFREFFIDEELKLLEL